MLTYNHSTVNTLRGRTLVRFVDPVPAVLLGDYPDDPILLSHGPDRRSMGDSCPLDPAAAQKLPTPRGRHARGAQRYLLSVAHRLCLAAYSARPAEVEHGLSLLRQVAQVRSVEEDSRQTPRAVARERGARQNAQCRDHRQPVGQDRRKRGEQRGYDAGKKIKGRKRHIVVDTLGLIIGVVVHAADVQDRDGAKKVIEEIRFRCPRMEKLWADGGYSGALIEWVEKFAGWNLEIVKRSDAAKGFELLPHRWIVERTFAWLSRYRRLSKDYEFFAETSENFIYMAMINLMLHRLAPEERNHNYRPRIQAKTA